MTEASGKSAVAGRTAPSSRAKVFWSGRSQAIRLPKEFRFHASEVAIRREGHRVILEPVDIEPDANGWPLALWQLAGAIPDLGLGDRRHRPVTVDLPE